MVNLLLALIFIRPFISSLAFPSLNIVYSFSLLVFLLIWIIFKGISLEKLNSVGLSIFLFIISLFICIAFSINKLISLSESYKYISAVLLFLICANLSSENKTKVIYAIIASGFLISILAIYQYFFGFKHILNYVLKMGIQDQFVLDYISQKRVFFPFVTPNILAGYLLLVMPLVFFLEGRKKIIIFLCIASGFLLTKSIGAFMSLLAGALIYFNIKKGLHTRKFIYLAIILVCFSAIILLRQTNAKEQFLPIFSIQQRLSFWRETLSIIKVHPFFGVGLGNFNLTQSRYAHNSYLQIWAEMGVPALASLFWLLYSIYKNTGKETLLFFASMLFLLHNLVDFSFFLPEISLIWWAVLGLALRIDKQT